MIAKRALKKVVVVVKVQSEGDAVVVTPQQHSERTDFPLADQ